MHRISGKYKRFYSELNLAFIYRVTGPFMEYDGAMKYSINVDFLEHTVDKI